jgi:hypothetical protein
MPLIALLIAVVGVMILIVLALLLAMLISPNDETGQAVLFIIFSICMIVIAWCVLGVLVANDPVLGTIRMIL